MSKEICSHKDKFMLNNKHYLNCAYMGPLSIKTQEQGMKSIRMKGMPGNYLPKHFFCYLRRLRTSFSKLINISEPERIAILPSVSYGMATVVNNLIIKSKGNIVLMQNEMPSNYYIWQRFTDENDLELRIVNHTQSKLYNTKLHELISEAIDNNTIAVSCGAVHWQDGALVDIKEVSKQAHEKEALFIFDGTQSLGVMPYNQKSVNADAVISAGYKWMLGPYSLALGYYGSFFDKGRPLEEPWLNRANSEQFKNLTDYNKNYREKSIRYDVGEASNFILCPMLETALDQLVEWGIDHIYNYVGQLTNYIECSIRDIKPELVTNHLPRANHFLSLNLSADTCTDNLISKLREKDVFVSIRGSSLRISPHIYNDYHDAESVIELVTDSI